jgi:hypothetical protein
MASNTGGRLRTHSTSRKRRRNHVNEPLDDEVIVDLAQSKPLPIAVETRTDDPQRLADWVVANRLSPDDKQRLWRHLSTVAPGLVDALRSLSTCFAIEDLYFDIRRSDPVLHAELLAASARSESQQA